MWSCSTSFSDELIQTQTKLIQQPPRDQDDREKGGGGEWRERLFWIIRSEHLLNVKEGAGKWQQVLDTQHLCGFLGRVGVRWGAGILDVYKEL